ncbi:MAG: hypothetical protein IT162_06350 [Bryobacterales bacterium]|nr:hypothetical protein [Bryobacterales bacterium]
MIVATAVGICSILLLAYWFRYTSLLILSTKTSQDYSYEIAHAHELQFHEVRESLPAVAPARLERLHSDIDHDFRLVTALLRNVRTSDRRVPVEDLILRLDYLALDIAFRFCRSDALKRTLLTEMSDVVAYFANVVGERSMAAHQANPAAC